MTVTHECLIEINEEDTAWIQVCDLMGTPVHETTADTLVDAMKWLEELGFGFHGAVEYFGGMRCAVLLGAADDPEVTYVPPPDPPPPADGIPRACRPVSQ